MSAVKFERADRLAIRSDGDSSPVYVLVDGETVGVVRKRSEWYGNLGHRGVRYWYFDFFRVDADRRPIREKTSAKGELASASTRKACVAEALVLLGYDEAALSVDSGTASFYLKKRAETRRYETEEV